MSITCSVVYLKKLPRTDQESFHLFTKLPTGDYRVYSYSILHILLSSFVLAPSLSTSYRKLDAATKAVLQTNRLGHEILSFDTLDSTNTQAKRWAERGAPAGGLVLAEVQTAGRGRMGRTWESTSGLNLLFSVILRPKLLSNQLGLLTLAAAVAVAEAITPIVAPTQVRIKWPNDILIGSRKCCGILLESCITSNEVSTVVLGIGLNVNQTTFPDHITEKATSLLIETGHAVDRPSLLADLLLRLEQWLDSLHIDSGVAVRKAYLRHVQQLGQHVFIYRTSSGAPVRGRFAGITDSGGLLLQTSEKLLTFHAGEITSQP